MIGDDIYYGNLLGLLKTGKWTVNVAESIALVKVYQETERRLSPPALKKVDDPIKPLMKKEKKK